MATTFSKIPGISKVKDWKQRREDGRAERNHNLDNDDADGDENYRKNETTEQEHEIQKLRTELGSARSTIQHVLARERDMETKAGKIAAERDSFYTENQRLQRRESEAHQKAEAKVSRIWREHAETVRKLNRQTEELKEAHKSEKQRMHDGFSHKMGAAQSTYSQVLQERDSDRQKLVENNAAQLSKLQDSLKQADNQHSKEIARLNVHMEKVQADHAEQLESVTVAHSVEIKDLRQTLASKHQQQTKDLQENVRDLNGALLTRDDDMYQGSVFAPSNLPHNPDGQLRDQFLKIQQIVEDLSRLEWKHDRRLWTDQLMQKMRREHGQRSVRKAIVQDIIWTILFRAVFCSPFRMFGEEGNKLEREWNEQCGKDPASETRMYRWPPPSIKAERWRYMTMKECCAILGSPQPSEIDARARIRTGFKTSLNRLVSGMKATIGEVADLTPEYVQMIQQLSTKASSLWFDFAMHRCRIVIRLKASEVMSMQEKVAAARSGSLALTVLPEVGRHGNVKGIELDTFTVIAGCAGESFTFS